MGLFDTAHKPGEEYPSFFNLSGAPLSRMIGFAAGTGFVSVRT